MQNRHLTGLVVALVLALAAFTGSALAGGGNGNGGGGGNGNANDHATQAPAPQTSQPSHDSHGSSSKQSDTSASNPASGGDNSHGVKPSNQTKHDTYAKASSDKTKQYGNGKTAGQIATQSGHGDATLHGPGNSQPHKTSPCPGGHEVDVHALKNKGSKCAGSQESKPASHESKSHESKSHESKSHESKPASHESKTETHSSVAGQHATICHATGSSSNPFVMISPDVSGVFHGHLGHQDARDIVPPFTYNGQTYSQNWDSAGQAIFNAGCHAPAAAPQVQGAQHTEETTDCGTTTKTVSEQVVVGVKHFIGPKGSGRFVIIHPSTHSAHFKLKHPDEILYDTVQHTIVVKNADCPAVAQTQTVTTQSVTTQVVTTAAATQQTQTTAQVAGTQAAQTAAPVTAAATPVAAGGVKGATATLKPKAKKPAGGVLGTTTRLGSTVASTNLPFTGLPLWIFVAIAAALILAGATVRRSAGNRV
jgi:hypothetical protein